MTGTCRCGRTTSPVYGGQCEDCWVKGNCHKSPVETETDFLGPHLEVTHSAITPHAQRFGDDRHWVKRAGKVES